MSRLRGMLECCYSEKRTAEDKWAFSWPPLRVVLFSVNSFFMLSLMLRTADLKSFTGRSFSGLLLWIGRSYFTVLLVARPYLRYEFFCSFEPLLSFSKSTSFTLLKPFVQACRFFASFSVTVLKSASLFTLRLSSSLDSWAWVLRWIFRNEQCDKIYGWLLELFKLRSGQVLSPRRL